MWVQRAGGELSHMVGNKKTSSLVLTAKQLHFEIKILITHFQRRINTVFSVSRFGARDEFHQFMNNSWTNVPVFLSYVEYVDHKVSRKSCSINYIQQDIIVECKPTLWKFGIFVVVLLLYYSDCWRATSLLYPRELLLKKSPPGSFPLMRTRPQLLPMMKRLTGVVDIQSEGI